MNLVEKIKNLFTRKQIENKTEILKTLETIEVFDDVILVINGVKFNGWVSGKTKGYLIICYDADEPLKEIMIPYDRPLNKTIVEFNDKVLYLNKNEY